MHEEELREAFQGWLARCKPEFGELKLGAFEMPQSGFSAKTVFVPASYIENGQPRETRVVLRMESPEPAIYPKQAPDLDVEIHIQDRAMEALHRTGAVPLAPLIGYEADPGILGTPFFAMEFIGGHVMIENPPYTQAGFFAEAAPARRREIITEGLSLVAQFHTIDWQKAGFEWLLGPGEEGSLLRQLEIWEDYAIRELQGRVHPTLALAFRWLANHAPGDLQAGLSWGDSRPGNIIFGDDRPLCITDFENIAVAPVGIDLGWWLMFDRSQHEAVGIERLEGEPSRDEQREIYARAAGIATPDTQWFEIFAGARYAAIVVRVMNRLVERGDLPAEHNIWIENPAADTLQQLLDVFAISDA